MTTHLVPGELHPNIRCLADILDVRHVLCFASKKNYLCTVVRRGITEAAIARQHKSQSVLLTLQLHVSCAKKLHKKLPGLTVSQSGDLNWFFKKKKKKLFHSFIVFSKCQCLKWLGKQKACI